MEEKESDIITNERKIKKPEKPNQSRRQKI